MKANLRSKEIEKIMKKTDKVRNLCIFGNPDHGRHTFLDSLLYSRLGLNRTYPMMGDCYNENFYDAFIMKGIVPFFSLIHNVGSEQEDDDNILVNVCTNIPYNDSHEYRYGSSDFERTRFRDELRNFDGGIGIVFPVEGVSGEFKDLLYDMHKNRVKTILMINRIDDMILELAMEKEKCYQSFLSVISQCNREMNSFNHFSESKKSEQYFVPTQSNVIFGSALGEWGFTIGKFADVYSRKFGVPKEKLVRRFWGDHFFNTKTRKFSGKKRNEDTQRAFCQFILTPIYEIYDACMNNKKGKLRKIMKSLGITLDRKQEKYEGKKLSKVVLNKFLSLNDQVMSVIRIHIPPPKVAQLYRKDIIYNGRRRNCRYKDDSFSVGVSKMDENGPFMMYVCNEMYQANTYSGKKTYRFGRIFSGSLDCCRKMRSGDVVEVTVIPLTSKRFHPHYLEGRKKEMEKLGRRYRDPPKIKLGEPFDAKIEKAVVLIGRDFFQPEGVLKSGCFCGLFLVPEKKLLFETALIIEKGKESKVLKGETFDDHDDEEEVERMLDCLILTPGCSCVVKLGGGKLEFPRFFVG